MIRAISIIAKLSHLRVSKTSQYAAARSSYFLPRHPLGPKEKGWDASLISRFFSSSQRSGRNEKGSLKLRSSWVRVQALVYTSVCVLCVSRLNLQGALRRTYAWWNMHIADDRPWTSPRKALRARRIYPKSLCNHSSQIWDGKRLSCIHVGVRLEH